MSHAMKHQGGFTVVEVLVTIFVASIFLISSTLLYSTITSASAAQRYRAEAGDLAYANLRKYAYSGASPSTWSTPFVCNATDDYNVNPNAPGMTLDNQPTVTGTTLPNPVSSTVTATAVFGCSSGSETAPVKVTSTVTYGDGNIKIIHSTLVGY